MAVSDCKCVKWHAPPTKRYFVTPGGERICPVSGLAVGELIERYQKKGRVTQVAGRGFTSFQRALASQLFEAGAVLVMEEPELEAEPVGAAASE